jgi:hypothetical protein
MDAEALGDLLELEPVRGRIIGCIFNVIRGGFAGRIECVQLGECLFTLL